MKELLKSMAAVFFGSLIMCGFAMELSYIVYSIIFDHKVRTFPAYSSWCIFITSTISALTQIKRSPIATIIALFSPRLLDCVLELLCI